MCLFTISVNAQSFSDVNESNWFYDNIISAVEKGYIQGYEDGTFRPNDYVSFGEFYKMIVVAMGEEDKIVIDNHRHWAYPYSKFLLSNGDNAVQTYSLDNYIKREDAVRSLLYLCGIENVVDSEFYEEQPFIDMPSNNINYSNGYLYQAYEKGIIFGDEKKCVNPKSKITRAEAVSIIERALIVNDWSVVEPEVLKGLEVNFVGKYSETYLNDVCDSFSRFPEYIIEEFVKGGFKYTVTNEIDDNRYAGIYNLNDKEIVIYVTDMPSSFFNSHVGTMIHEMGHFLHINLLSEEDFDKILEIYNDGKEVKELSKYRKSDYCETDEYEFFAELVCYYLSTVEKNDDFIKSESYKIVEKYLTESNI
jgi:hypothetical protein